MSGSGGKKSGSGRKTGKRAGTRLKAGTAPKVKSKAKSRLGTKARASTKSEATVCGTSVSSDSSGADGSKRQRGAGTRRKSVSDASPVSSPETTRDKLVESARHLFWAKGYEATGISEILREAGVNSGSLYYFFRTKEQLLLAVLDQYIELLHPQVMEPAFAQTDDPIERVFAVMDGYRQMLVLTECRQGCPIGNLALEMSEKSDAVRKKIAINFENWREAIHGCLQEAADRFVSGVNLDQLSSFFLTVMEGAVMQARAHRNLQPYEDAMTMMRNYVDRLVQNEN